jgi:hypothetical protein
LTDDGSAKLVDAVTILVSCITAVISAILNLRNLWGYSCYTFNNSSLRSR